MILNIFRKRERVTLDTARVPDKTRIYVVGDIHGRADLLKHLHKLILKDSAKVTSDVRKVIVFLGDYIDRGLQSKEVIDFLLDNPLKGFEAVFLKGNHEEQFLNFLNDVNLGSQWLRIGGNAMVHSYGIHIQESLPLEDRLPRLQRELNDTFPKRHLDFLSRLELNKEIGDYYFVHAGINPYEPLIKQTPEDMLWIRDEFLDAEANYGVIIVHGHSVTDAPDIQDNRIGIDTGAFASNILTCLVLEGATKRFLQTK